MRIEFFVKNAIIQSFILFIFPFLDVQEAVSDDKQTSQGGSITEELGGILNSKI